MTWKIVGVSLYLIALLAIGLAASRKMKDVRDFYAGGKSLGFLAVAFSSRATGESAWLLLGLTGMGAAIGAKAFWVVVGETIGVAGAWLIMSRRFKRLTDHYDSITIPDYLDSRFADRGPNPKKNNTIRVVAAGALMIFVTIYVSAQIDATGKAFEDFLGWHYYVGIAVGFVVVLGYITFGGFVAVVWSDVFQGSLMVLGLIVLPIAGLGLIGGPGALVDELDPGMLTAFGPAGATGLGIASVLGLALIGLGFMGAPQIFVRFLALKSESEISKGVIVAILWTLLADGGAVLAGMVGRVALTRVGNAWEGGMKVSEDVLPLLVEITMPPFLIGLYIAVVLSAIMSTVDSLLVLSSSAVVRDTYQQVLHPELPDDELVGKSRIATILLALAALAISLIVAVISPDRTVFWFVIFGWSGIAATFCPVMILSLFWGG